MKIEYLEPDSIRSTNKKRASLTFDPPSFCMKPDIIPMPAFSTASIIGCVDLEICLRMLADRAEFRCLLANHDMSAVAALPDYIIVL